MSDKHIILVLWCLFVVSMCVSVWAVNEIGLAQNMCLRFVR